MRKRFIGICIVGALLCGICGCTRTAEDDSVAKKDGTESKNIDAEDIETVMSVGEYGPNEEEIVSSESVNDHSETDMTSLQDVIREMEEYKSHFIELYSSNALSGESLDAEPEMIIEEHDFPGDGSESASLTVYSRLSGKHLRYELHYYGETGNSVINYYLCNSFVWVSRQNNYYSSLTLSAEYSDVLYSTIENWIITNDAAYIMHDNGELEEIDRTQLESEIPMPDEIAVIEKEQRQIEKF